MKVKLLTDKKIIKIEDAEFEIGVIDRATYQDVYFRFSSAAIILNPKNSVKIEENASEEEKALLLERAKVEFLDSVAREKAENPEKYRKATSQLNDAFKDFCRYGVKNHTNILTEADQPFEFKKDENGNVADEVLNVYDLNGVIGALGLEVMAFNRMTEKERKN